MVKNTTGGSHFKKMSRKQNAANFNYDSLNDPNIVNVSVMKALGDGRFYVANNKSEEWIMHIPGRFKGRNKHRNFVSVNSLVKVQLREYETSTKTCDLLQIIQSTTPHNFFISGSCVPAVSATMSDLENHIIFTHVEQPEEMTEQTNKRTGITAESETDLEALENINFDEI